MKTILTLLTLIPLLTNNAIAAPRLNVYYVQDPKTLPIEILPTYLNDIKQKLAEEFGVNIRIRVKGISNHLSNNSLSLVSQTFYSWNDRIQSRRQGAVWALVIVPRFEQNGRYYIAGMARRRCFKTARFPTIAMISPMTQNASSEQRYLHSVIGAIHELGHTLGLRHNEASPANIMNYGVLTAPNLETITFSTDDRIEGRRCLR